MSGIRMLADAMGTREMPEPAQQLPKADIGRLRRPFGGLTPITHSIHSRK